MPIPKLTRALLYPSQSDLPGPLRLHARRGPGRKTHVSRNTAASLGAYLRACRMRKGRNGRGEWSLRSVAREAEMNHSILSQVETGKRRAVADDLLHLADVLGEDREELLVRAGYLPASALDNRGAFNLTAVERRLIEQVRAHPRLLEPLNALLSAMA